MTALCLQSADELREDRATRNARSACQSTNSGLLSSAGIRLRHLNNVRHFFRFVRERPDFEAIEASLPARMAASARLVMLSTPGAPPLTFRPFRCSPPVKPQMRGLQGRQRPQPKMEDTMRVLTQTELNRLTRGELLALLLKIAQMLPDLADGSDQLRAAHVNLQSIRKALSQMHKPAMPKM